MVLLVMCRKKLKEGPGLRVCSQQGEQGLGATTTGTRLLMFPLFLTCLGDAWTQLCWRPYKYFK